MIKIESNKNILPFSFLNCEVASNHIYDQESKSLKQSCERYCCLCSGSRSKKGHVCIQTHVSTNFLLCVDETVLSFHLARYQRNWLYIYMRRWFTNSEYLTESIHFTIHCKDSVNSCKCKCKSECFKLSHHAPWTG